MEIQKLINSFAKLPNLGPASSRRLVLYLLRHKENIMLPLANKIKDLAQQVRECEICFNIDTQSPCLICSSIKRDSSLLCIVEELGDIWAFEKGNIFSGLYHVLGGTLSAINGIGPDNLNLSTLVNRIKKFNIKEVIIATNATLDGQVTSHYITTLLQGLEVKISRPACGIPVGSEIDYLDEGTLSAALKSRYTI